MFCHAVIKHPIFETISLLVIVVNSITLALDNKNLSSGPEGLEGLDLIIYYCD